MIVLSEEGYGFVQIFYRGGISFHDFLFHGGNHPVPVFHILFTQCMYIKLSLQQPQGIKSKEETDISGAWHLDIQNNLFQISYDIIFVISQNYSSRTSHFLHVWCIHQAQSLQFAHHCIILLQFVSCSVLKEGA
jgi:hypothetical protein